MRLIALLTIVLLSGSSYGAIISGQGNPGSAVPGGPILDFQAFPGGQTSIVFGNATITGGTGSFRCDTDFANDFNTTNRYMVNGDYESSGTTILTAEFQFVFASPVTAFAFNFGASGDTWRLTAFDSSNAIIETHLLPATGSSNAGDYFGILANGISRAVLRNTTPTNEDLVFVDNFVYGNPAVPETVPEPTAVAIWGLGALGCAVAAYRRRRLAA